MAGAVESFKQAAIDIETLPRVDRDTFPASAELTERRVVRLLPDVTLKEMLAALRGGIKTVIIPEETVKDLAEIPDNVKQGLEIVPVKWIDKVLEVALVRQPQPLPEEDVKVEAKPEAAGAAPASPASNDLLKH